ncbi:MAG: DUF4357 domain-containing protein [Candidatus Omnitrophica bacterium]|nr:DUF4357 domain-containing protein [Candidatus Omnitrophota bacterium]
MFIHRIEIDAAGKILGRSANGWTEWKTKEGKILDEIKRK